MKQTRLRQGAKALAVRDESVLLIKEHHADGTPFWTLPGGGVKPNESATDALHRELREEIRCSAKINEWVDQFVYAHHSVSVMTVYDVFAGAISGGVDPAITDGIFESTWATSETVPPYTLPQVKLIMHSQL